VTTFAEILALGDRPTPFGFFDLDPLFQQEADSLFVFVRRTLGDDTISVELTNKQVWACFEQSLLEFGSLVNQYQTISQIQSFLGIATGSLSGSEQKYPRESLEFTMRRAEPYAAYAGVGGAYNSVSGSIVLEPGVQDYDLYKDLKNDTTGEPLATSFASGSRMRIGEVFHFSPSAAFRFFDSTSAINYLNNEFGFESFTPETIFYVLPVFEDVLRAGMMKISQRVRRSNYSYLIVGTKIRIYPAPQTSITGNALKLWIRVYRVPDPLNPDVPDNTINGVSNIANIPFGRLEYSKINSGIAHQWIRQMTLALCKEVLGRIRSKFKQFPIPGAELSLDGESLIAEAREDQARLRDQFKELLDSLTYDKIIEREATKGENLLRQLRLVPIPSPIFVR
jgi:hypothetical protein